MRLAARVCGLHLCEPHHARAGAGGVGWPFVDRLPPERACDPSLLDDEDPIPLYTLKLLVALLEAP